MSTRDDETQLVAFRLGSQEYALPIENVVQVTRIVAITPTPEPSDYVKGVINLRGKVVPVIDTRRRLGMRVRPYDLDTQLLIARHDGHVIALLVDAVSEVLSLPTGSIEPSSELGSKMKGVSAVGKLADRLLLIPDIANMVPSDYREQLEQVTGAGVQADTTDIADTESVPAGSRVSKQGEWLF